MTYGIHISESLDKKLRKLCKKNSKFGEAIGKKLEQIRKHPHHYKELRGDKHGARRVHILSSFVLVFEIDEEESCIKVLDIDHHDKVY